MKQQVQFPSGKVDYYFQSSINELWNTYDRDKIILITDDNIRSLYADLFSEFRTISIPAGESSKELSVLVATAEKLLQFGATRGSLLVGIGGGVITDITGMLASVYMRGVSFGFVPTTLLGAVDAAIGGKNGINLGVYKNILGTIRQPSFILFDSSFLQTLPDKEWSNGFAEIIKYACLFDPQMYQELTEGSVALYCKESELLDSLILRCVQWKNKTAIEDEHEKSSRKLLNFGHTAGHAIENLYHLSHGAAVALGMIIACEIAESETALAPSVRQNLVQLLKRYNLPATIELDCNKVMEILSSDKKRTGDTIDYILLNDIGKPVIKPLALSSIAKALQTYERNH